MNLSNKELESTVPMRRGVQANRQTINKQGLRASLMGLLACFSLMLIASAASANFFIKVENQTLNRLLNENLDVVMLSPDNNFVYTLADSGNVLGIWAFDSVNGTATFQDAITAEEMWPDIPGIAWTTHDMAISSDGQQLYVLGGSGSPQSQSFRFGQTLVKLNRDTTTGALSYEDRIELPGVPGTTYLQLSMTPDNLTAFALSASSLQSIDTSTMSIVNEFTGSSADGTKPPTGVMTISGDGRLLAVGGIPKRGGDNPSIILFDVDVGTGALSPRVIVRPQVLADGTDPLLHGVDDLINAMAISEDGFLYAAGRRVVGNFDYIGLSQWSIRANSLEFVSTIDKQTLLAAGAPQNSQSFFTGIDDLRLSSQDQRFLYVEEGPGGNNGQIIALLRDPSTGQLSWSGSAQGDFPTFTISLDTTSSGRYVLGAHRGSGNAGGYVTFDTAANLQALVSSEPSDESNTLVTATLSNNGPTTAVVSTMTVQADTTLVNSSADCTGSGTNSVSCNLGDIASGESAVRDFLIMTPADGQSQTVTVSGSSYKFDPDSDNNTTGISITSTGSTENDLNDDDGVNSPLDDGSENNPVAVNTSGSADSSSSSGGCSILPGRSDWGLSILVIFAILGLLRRRKSEAQIGAWKLKGNGQYL